MKDDVDDGEEDKVKGEEGADVNNGEGDNFKEAEDTAKVEGTGEKKVNKSKNNKTDNDEKGTVAQDEAETLGSSGGSDEN